MVTNTNETSHAIKESLPQPEVIKVKDLATRWGYCRATITRMIQSGELKALSRGRPNSRKPHYRILMSDVLRIEGALPQAQQEPPAQTEHSANNPPAGRKPKASIARRDHW